MIQILLSLVLAVGLPAEQPQNANATSAPSPLPHAADTSVPDSIKPEDPVVTVRGICKNRGSKPADPVGCKTIVSRKQFERLLEAFATGGQPVPANGRRQLAQSYVDLLAFEEAARASGIESSPEFQDLMELVRLRTLADLYRRKLQERYRTPSQKDIDDYYHQNISNFIEIRLRRVLIPRKNPSVADQAEYEKRALEVANGLWERATRGDDIDQLQKQGYTAVGLASPPATDLGNRRKANLLPEIWDEILSLEPGGISKLEHEAYSFVIYKVEAKRVLPEDAVRDEIAREIFRQRLENALKEATAGIVPEFNPGYFPPGPSLNPPPSSPPALR